MTTENDLPPLTLEWDDAALAALKHVPALVRRGAARSVETYAMVHGHAVVTPDIMRESRAAKEAGTHPDQKPSKDGRGSPAEGTEEIPRQFVNFSFLKLDPAFRRLPEAERARLKGEFVEMYKSWAQDRGIILRSYSLVGTRADCDLMFWRIGYDMDALQKMASETLKTGLGAYLTPAYSYLSMTKRSQYEDKEHPAHNDTRTRIVPGRAKYIFVYPFVKTREWYLLPLEERQRVMDEHIDVGNKYNRVKINTTYSFGLDDQDFVVAFESNYPQDFLDLVMELRETQSSLFTVRDVPIFTCVRREIEEVVDLIG